MAAVAAEPVVCIKNTFIDFVREPRAEDLQRTRSEVHRRDDSCTFRRWTPIAPLREEGLQRNPAGDKASPAKEVCLKNTFISIEAPGHAQDLRYAQSDSRRQRSVESETTDDEPPLEDDADLDDDCLDRSKTIDGYEPFASGKEPWFLLRERELSPLVERTPGAQAPPAVPGGRPGLRYVPAIMYVPMVISAPPPAVAPVTAVAVPSPVGGPLQQRPRSQVPSQQSRAQPQPQPPQQHRPSAVAPRDVPAPAAGREPSRHLPHGQVACDGAADDERAASGSELGVQRLSKPGSVVQRFRWTVDARKLKSSDRAAVSPEFTVHFSGPLQFRPLRFKMFVHPATSVGSTGGTSFKKARGRGRLELACLQQLDAGDAHPAQFRFRVGSAPPGSSRQHDFALAPACRGACSDEWDFRSQVDPRSQTFVIDLDIVAGAEASRAGALDLSVLAP